MAGRQVTVSSATLDGSLFSCGSLVDEYGDSVPNNLQTAHTSLIDQLEQINSGRVLMEREHRAFVRLPTFQQSSVQRKYPGTCSGRLSANPQQIIGRVREYDRIGSRDTAHAAGQWRTHLANNGTVGFAGIDEERSVGSAVGNGGGKPDFIGWSDGERLGKIVSGRSADEAVDHTAIGRMEIEDGGAFAKTSCRMTARHHYPNPRSRVDYRSIQWCHRSTC